MLALTSTERFPRLNEAYSRTFIPRRLTLGLVVPIEHYPDGPVPSLVRHVERVELAERLGFRAVWLRDVPFNVPSFADAGQIHDPFVYLGLLAGRTQTIALGVASVILPLRHPAHVAKAAASVESLSQGRLLLGIASGDRPEEYPATAVPFDDRGARFRDAYRYIRRMAQTQPTFDSPYGSPRGVDMLPKPAASRLPLLITGSSQQSPDWIASNGDGWMTYPRNVPLQARIVAEVRARARAADAPLKPVMQPLYLDLDDDPDAGPTPIHLGFRSGTNTLRAHLDALQTHGMNHVALNLRFNRADIESTLERLAETVLPHFNP